MTWGPVFSGPCVSGGWCLFWASRVREERMPNLSCMDAAVLLENSPHSPARLFQLLCSAWAKWRRFSLNSSFCFSITNGFPMLLVFLLTLAISRNFFVQLLSGHILFLKIRIVTLKNNQVFYNSN